ncbi:poly(beta-D-mannuronate) lyase [Nonlabens xylanidelens]|uniref:Poly(Beta-D-mannuronate) lyase n=1 Tax=Nonlabens xylanidelens TaxID=191564 RepID=A0A2S6IJL4_9FLAO|nr:chondroitinase-B domain-containing protein [Nonlabens xylanidelens]PPK94422.1 poly(beta-D-mannuronate) lyase [Nonlabens xylanidelens]PQJ21418.1 alginate lyase [Nonlabens xylanidelens]
MKRIFLLALAIALISCNDQKLTSINVSNIDELQSAIDDSKAGDVITMKNGIWKDAQIKFHGMGTEQKPIVLKAETPGEVILEGQSFLKLSGEYLVAKDLYFKNGYTPDEAVIIFRNSPDSIAFNCRVTGTVIEEFTQPDRHRKDHWIEFYGKHNELDHSYIAGKSNEGPTLKVYLNGNEHVNNYHKIHDNHFGPRPRKGGPKAETMQLGASTTSMTPSYTQVTNNLFEKCNGEVEIISSKSNFNNFSNNVFLESEGSVVTRHGNYATISGNIFIGNDNPYVGGIRVINTGHVVTNNYFYKMRGTEFRSGLAVMNGIPKSPLNRYNQVTDVVIAHNSWIDCEQPIHFSVGVNTDQAEVLPPSEIRSARPKRVIFANNLVYNDRFTSYPIKAYDKIDGVKFKNNLLLSNKNMDSDREDFTLKSISNTLGDELFYTPAQYDGKLYDGYGFNDIDVDLFGKSRNQDQNYIGAIIPPVSDKKATVDYSIYGAKWFTPSTGNKDIKTHTVTNASEFMAAIKDANSEDILSLKEGTYLIDETITLAKELKITSANKDARATIQFDNLKTAFLMQPKGILHLENLNILGTADQDFFRTEDKDMSKAYGIHLNDISVENFKSVLDASKSSFADEIIVNNSTFKNCINGFLLDKEIDDKGDYNVEFLTITKSNFDNISNEVIDFYRGGYDESTIGGILNLSGNTFTNSGKLDKDEILINTRGIVNVTFENNTFTNNDTKFTAVLWGAKGQQPVNNTVTNSGEIKVVENIELKLVY